MSLGKLITNLQTALTNEDEKDDKNYLSRFQLQGEKYLKYNEMRTNEIKPQFKLMENFSIINNNAVETKNNKEIQALIDLDKEYKKKLSDYSEQRQILMRDTNMYLNKMSSSEKIKFYQNYIANLKISDSIAAKKAADKLVLSKNNQKADMFSGENFNDNLSTNDKNFPGGITKTKNPILETPLVKQSTNSVGLQSNFYFYNAVTVAQGKLNFKKKWGNIKYGDNWKSIAVSNQNQTENAEEETDEEKSDKTEEVGLEPKYKTSFYIDQLPKDAKVLDSLNTEANYARFQLGAIFKEKLKENKLAITSFEDILVNTPESKLELPTYYNLYQLYGAENNEKALAYKQRILSEYPESRFASAFNNTTINTNITADSEFYELYTKVEKGMFREANLEIDALLKKYDGDELNAKFDVLKAKISARLFGLSAYKMALQKVVKNYPKAEETKKIASILSLDIPVLESLKFGEKPKTYNLVFITNYPNELSHKNLIEKLNKYAKESGDNKVKVSNDIYNVEKNMIVLHGIINKATAESVYNYLKEHKDYKIKDTPFIISNEDYKVVQVKKNVEEYLAKIK